MDISLETNELWKINLIHLFNLIALLFTIPLSLNSIFSHQFNIGLPLLAIAIVILLNHYYLKKSKDINTASHVIAMLFFTLMLYLAYTGGVNNTGSLWISSFPIIVFFLLGLRKGFIYILSFLVLVSIILFFPFESALKADYTYAYKLRIILSFLLITFLAAMYEYTNAKSFNNMQKLKEELEYSSTRDYLTSLYNRRGYDKKIEKLKNTQGIVLMCDIDYFKHINDTYGHHAGDFILQQVATNVKSILRDDDIAVRWGGEEFFIFLPQTDMDDGYLVAEKIRKSTESLILDYQGKHLTVTFSIGLEEVTQDITLENAITNADNAMYLAKKAGRNTVSIYTKKAV